MNRSDSKRPGVCRKHHIVQLSVYIISCSFHSPHTPLCGRLFDRKYLAQFARIFTLRVRSYLSSRVYERPAYVICTISACQSTGCPIRACVSRGPRRDEARHRHWSLQPPDSYSLFLLSSTTVLHKFSRSKIPQLSVTYALRCSRNGNPRQAPRPRAPSGEHAPLQAPAGEHEWQGVS